MRSTLKHSLKDLIAVVAALLLTGLSLPVLPASAEGIADGRSCQVGDLWGDLWDGSSGYIETSFASLTGSGDGLRPVSTAGLWDGNEGTSEPMVFASVTGSIEGLPPTPVAGLWDGSEGTSEPTEFASASAQHDGAASSQVVALRSHKTPCGMTN